MSFQSTGHGSQRAFEIEQSGTCAGEKRRGAVESVYYKVIGFVLLFPWFTVGLMFLGYIRGRWVPKG